MTPMLDRITSQPGRAIEADKRMVARLDLTSRILFLLTNLPYWVVFIAAVVNAVKVQSSSPNVGRGIVESLCDMPALHVVGLFCVATASTVMHTSQMRLGGFICGCACNARSKSLKRFHSPNLLKKLKALDSSCALTAVLTLGTCHGWLQVFEFFAFAFPVFMLGLFSKRFNYHYTYITLHGLWHFLTAFLAWKALLRR